MGMACRLVNDSGWWGTGAQMKDAGEWYRPVTGDRAEAEPTSTVGALAVRVHSHRIHGKSWPRAFQCTAGGHSGEGQPQGSRLLSCPFAAAEAGDGCMVLILPGWRWR